MSEVCRLCLSLNSVNNLIFGDDNKIYLKITACLPVKVAREDMLPKKICDPCSCKIDDFYHFCNKAVEAENRLSRDQLNTHKSIEDLPNGAIDNIVLLSGTSKNILSKYCEDNQLKNNGPRFHSQELYPPAISNNFPSNIHLTGSISNTLVSTHSQTDECLDFLKLNDIKKEIQQNIYSDDEDYSPFIEDLKFEPDSKSKINKEFRIPEETVVTRIKHQKKSRKSKHLKVKIKKSHLDARVKSNYQSDSDDGVSLKKLKSSTSESPGDQQSSGWRESHLIEGVKIKTEVPEFIGVTIKDEIDETGEVWNCCVCFERFFSKNEILNHYRTHYSHPERMEDSYLNISYTAEDGEQQKKVFHCVLCDTKYGNKASYTKHMTTHGNDKPYRCSLCEKTFKNPLEILKHGMKAHKYVSVGEQEGDIGDGPKPSTKRFMCDICDEAFVYMKYLMTHRHAAHVEARGRGLVHRCLHCRREFSHLNSLRRHLRSHSGERNFLCYVCGKALTSREHLKFHIRIHTGFKPNVCQTCGKGFVKKCNLTLHERVHSGERPHVCSHCGKAFSQRSTLVIHERYHSGARPYVCNLCNKGFVAKGLLSMHLKTSCI